MFGNRPGQFKGDSEQQQQQQGGDRYYSSQQSGVGSGYGGGGGGSGSNPDSANNSGYNSYDEGNVNKEYPVTRPSRLRGSDDADDVEI